MPDINFFNSVNIDGDETVLGDEHVSGNLTVAGLISTVGGIESFGTILSSGIDIAALWLSSFPTDLVSSVNTKTGDVVLSAGDVGALSLSGGVVYGNVGVTQNVVLSGVTTALNTLNLSGDINVGQNTNITNNINVGGVANFLQNINVLSGVNVATGLSASSIYVAGSAHVGGPLGLGTNNPDATKQLHVVGDVIVYGDLSANGTMSFTNTLFTTTSALSIVNSGTGPAISVYQNGDQPIAAFYDHTESGIALWVDGSSDRPGWVGIKTETPNEELTVVGDISATGRITANEFSGDGSLLTSVTGIDASKLPVVGGTITHDLSVGGNLYGTLVDWMTLVRGYKSTPVLSAYVAELSANVYSYTYNTTGADVEYFRLIADDNSQDAFYTYFSGASTLSGLIATKSITLK